MTLDLDSKESHEDVKGKMLKERRSFFKKAVYSVPVLMAMGQLIKPASLHAEYGIDPEPTENTGFSKP